MGNRETLYMVKYLTKDGKVHEHTLMVPNGSRIIDILTNFTGVDVWKLINAEPLVRVLKRPAVVSQ